MHPAAGEESRQLQGLGVLVTRPEHQADALCQWIESHGGHAIRCPALRIVEPRDWRPALALFARLTDYDLLIFTSANAVDRTLPHITERGGFPVRLELAAIGQATARALARHGIDRCLRPEQDFTSEALLALPRFQQVAGQAIAIVRGEGGRELLADTLRSRGARVDHAEVYRRERPDIAIEPLLERWARGDIGAVIATSSETLSNLFDMLGAAGQHYLCQTPMIVVSTRTVQAAAKLGCHHLLLAQEASDAAIAAALLRLAAHPSLSVGNAT